MYSKLTAYLCKLKQCFQIARYEIRAKLIVFGVKITMKIHGYCNNHGVKCQYQIHLK